MGTPTTDIGPGIGAFVAFFLLALLLWFLMRNMNGRMRRMAYAERDRVARLEAEDLAREAVERGETPGPPPDRQPGVTGETAPAGPPPPQPQEPGPPSA